MIKNSNKFRGPSIHFQKYGYYTSAPKGTTAFRDFWNEESKKCLYGFVADDGDYITGYHYFYLNYTMISIVEEVDVIIGGVSRKVAQKHRGFPTFYDSDYEYFHYIEQAEKLGKHAVVLKKRRAGYSWKAASMLCRNFYLLPGSAGYAVASEAEFLTKDGILTKSWDLMSWIDANTAWTKKRQKVDTRMHKRASYIVDNNGTKIEAGFLSEIMGVTVKNDVQKIRGKAGKLILFEEAGKFPGLKEAWQIARPSVEQGTNVFGTLIAYGCVCEGTKVINNQGVPVNIEKLTKEDGILGYNTYSTEQQSVEHFREPYETECYKITTNSGRTLEASADHPIIYSHHTFQREVPGMRDGNKRYKMKSWKWKELQDFKVGDQVGIIEEIGIFGEERMWNPRLIGWLIGDGSYGYDKTPRLSNCEDEINKYIDDNFNTVIEKEYQTKDNKRYRETRIKDICSRLRDLGIYGQTKDNKRLPDLIFSCTKEDVCELLGGIFDTDGYISKVQNKTNHVVVLTSAYYNLLDQVSTLLLKIGVHSNIRYTKPNPKNPMDRNGYFRLEIKDTKSLIAFVNNITFFPKEKQSRLLSYKESLQTKQSESSKYVHGIRFERVKSIEKIGLRKVYNITASNTHTYIANGFITHNTGGTEDADYEGLKDLFYEIEAYNVLGVDNIWDEGGTKKCGFFVPEYVNMEGTDEEGNPFMDEDGNSLKEVAMRHILKERQKIFENATDKTAIDRYIAEHPLNGQEACLQISGNIFPKKDLIQQLSYIRNTDSIKSYKQVGELYQDPAGIIKWNQTDSKFRDITKYRIEKGQSKDGSIVIWEHPEPNPPWGLYIAGLDPYDHDQADSSESLGSCFIYKRFMSNAKTYNWIVAEYTGRPERAEQYYENVRLLLLYYNATCLYENQWPGFSVYMRNKHYDYLLADQPGVISKMIKDSRVQRGKGIHMVTDIKNNAELWLKDWLTEQYEPGKQNLTKILSEPLLEELIGYNNKGNFDRVISVFLIMIYLQELQNLHVKSNEDVSKIKRLFESPIFSSDREFTSFN